MNRIEAQYKTAGNLNTRISIHAKYSTNPQPFADWIVSHYEIAPAMKILELGCGTGDMWRDHLELLSGGAKLTLTDFSAGMLETARENLPIREDIAFQVADIQAIPFPNNAFDMVIANMMLYHVPDLHKGLSEVRRVLKPGGTFHCATYGENGITAYINDVLRPFHISGSIGKTFTLQNGGEILNAHFAKVQRFLREDGLAITDIGHWRFRGLYLLPVQPDRHRQRTKGGGVSGFGRQGGKRGFVRPQGIWDVPLQIAKHIPSRL